MKTLYNIFQALFALFRRNATNNNNTNLLKDGLHVDQKHSLQSQMYLQEDEFLFI